MEISISNFQSFGSSPNQTTINDALEDIKSDKYKKVIAEIRQLDKSDPHYQRLKNGLHHCTFSGTFEQRKKDSLIAYSKVIVLDIDDLDDAAEVRKKVEKDPHTAFLFISPGGKGLKIGVKVSSPAEKHEEAFNKVCKYYENKYQLEVDRSGKDVSRACFYSYDPDLYRNDTSKRFEVVEEQEDLESKVKRPTVLGRIDLSPYLFGPIEKKAGEIVTDDGRNNHCHQFACICNRMGYDRTNAIEYYAGKYEEEDFTKHEIETTIKGVYKRNAKEYGSDKEKGINFARKTTFRQQWQKRQPSLEAGPDFEKEVYEGLPQLLEDILKVSPHGNLKGQVLIASVTILSSILPKCRVKVGGKKYHANLYTLILAPPASGKGIIEDLTDITSEVDREMYAQKYNSKLGMKQETKRSLRIAGDTSKAGFIEQMNDCPNPNLMVDTEIDSTSTSNNQDWGNFSDKLRQAYEHETITSKRKKKDQIRIEKPALTLLLAGTPGQLKRFNDDIENGLASRLTPYSFRNDVYIRESDRKSQDMDKTLVSVAKTVKKLFDHHIDYPFDLEFTTDQLTRIDDYFENKHKEYKDRDALKAAILRMKVVLARLCLILSSIERFNEGNKAKTYSPSDQTFEIAMSMMKTLWEHQLCVMEYQGLKHLDFNSQNEELVFESLRDCFSASELYEAGKMVCKGDYSERTVRNWREGWEKKNYVLRRSHGSYCKM